MCVGFGESLVQVMHTQVVRENIDTASTDNTFNIYKRSMIYQLPLSIYVIFTKLYLIKQTLFSYSNLSVICYRKIDHDIVDFHY